jgi:hypothetical protein
MVRIDGQKRTGPIGLIGADDGNGSTVSRDGHAGVGRSGALRTRRPLDARGAGVAPMRVCWAAFALSERSWCHAVRGHRSAFATHHTINPEPKP